jgi:hypothetical protein
MKRTFFLFGFVVLVTVVLSSHAVAQTTTISVTVPGTSDPWLAGMPPGSTASGGDTAPAESPVETLGLTLLPGELLTFSATGGVANGSGIPLRGPDGSGFTPHREGAENGISDVVAPGNALMGIFLNANQPDLSTAPSSLDFRATGNVVGGVNYLSLSPVLKQVFFIGDGLTNDAATQTVVVPTGATRLFLGTMDGFRWSDNVGSFEVQVTAGPAPPTIQELLERIEALEDELADHTHTYLTGEGEGHNNTEAETSPAEDGE